MFYLPKLATQMGEVYARLRRSSTEPLYSLDGLASLHKYLEKWLQSVPWRERLHLFAQRSRFVEILSK